MQASTQSKRGPAQVLWLVFALGAVAYTIYACYTRTGVAGYAMKLQFDLWHSASEGTTVWITIGVMSVAYFGLLVIAQKLFPSARVLRVEAANLNRPLGPPSWKFVLIISLIPGLIGAVIAALAYRSDRLDAAAAVYSVDLSAPSTPLPKDARFVEVAGVIARSAVLTYRKTEDQKVTHEIFAPLVGRDSREPVRYIVHHEVPEEYDGRVAWPDSFLRRGTTKISGRVGWAVPAFAESGIRAKGVTLDPHYTVVEWKDLSYRQYGGTGSDLPWFVPAAGCGVLSFATFVMMLTVRIMLKRVRRAQSAAGVRF